MHDRVVWHAHHPGRPMLCHGRPMRVSGRTVEAKTTNSPMAATAGEEEGRRLRRRRSPPAKTKVAAYEEQGREVRVWGFGDFLVLQA